MEIVRIHVNPENVQIRYPAVCPHCLEPADTEWTTQFQFMRGRSRQYFTLNVPFRQACLDRQKSYQNRSNWMTLPVAFATILIGAGLIYMNGGKDAMSQIVLWAIFSWIIPYWLMGLLADRIIGAEVPDYQTLMVPLVQERVGQIGEDYFVFSIAQPEYARLLREANSTP